MWDKAFGGALLMAAFVLVAAPADANDGFGTFTKRIAPGKFDEQCFRLEAKQTASWQFEASGPVDFNLHWHRGKEVFYPVKRGAVTRDAGRYGAEHADDYCLMWENKGTQAVDLKGEVGKK